jgi:hypothetical protein
MMKPVANGQASHLALTFVTGPAAAFTQGNFLLRNRRAMRTQHFTGVRSSHTPKPRLICASERIKLQSRTAWFVLSFTRREWSDSEERHRRQSYDGSSQRKPELSEFQRSDRRGTRRVRNSGERRGQFGASSRRANWFESLAVASRPLQRRPPPKRSPLIPLLEKIRHRETRVLPSPAACLTASRMLQTPIGRLRGDSK